MLNGITDLLKRENAEEQTNDKKPKGKFTIIAIIAVLAIAIANLIYHYVSGNTQERDAIIHNITSNLHISIVDISIMGIILIALIVIKIIKNKK